MALLELLVLLEQEVVLSLNPQAFHMEKVLGHSQSICLGIQSGHQFIDGRNLFIHNASLGCKYGVYKYNMEPWHKFHQRDIACLEVGHPYRICIVKSIQQFLKDLTNHFLQKEYTLPNSFFYHHRYDLQHGPLLLVSQPMYHMVAIKWLVVDIHLGMFQQQGWIELEAMMIVVKLGTVELNDLSSQKSGEKTLMSHVLTSEIDYLVIHQLQLELDGHRVQVVWMVSFLFQLQHKEQILRFLCKFLRDRISCFHSREQNSKLRGKVYQTSMYFSI